VSNVPLPHPPSCPTICEQKAKIKFNALASRRARVREYLKMARCLLDYWGMAAEGEVSSEQLRALIQQLDDAVRDAELVRSRQMRARRAWPDRREPRHWERLPEDSSDPSSQG
jgi:hypothetical protein